MDTKGNANCQGEEESTADQGVPSPGEIPDTGHYF